MSFIFLITQKIKLGLLMFAAKRILNSCAPSSNKRKNHRSLKFLELVYARIKKWLLELDKNRDSLLICSHDLSEVISGVDMNPWLRHVNSKLLSRAEDLDVGSFSFDTKPWDEDDGDIKSS